MTTSNNNCLECNDPVRGRADKKFCSDSCRVSHHNRINAQANNYMRNVNNILKRNRRILKELNPNGKIKLHRDKLSEKGFNFKFCTNLYKTKSGNVYHFIYEQGYLALDNDYFALVERQEWMN